MKAGLLTRLRPVTTLLVALSLTTGQMLQCAGWLPTPEARMACCTDERTCPMHAGDDATEGIHHTLSQADADACCLASTSDDGSQSVPGFVLAPALDVVHGSALATTPAVWPMTPGAREPVPNARIPRYLLLSVFIV